MTKRKAVFAVILALLIGYGAGYSTYVYRHPYRQFVAHNGQPANPQPEVTFVHPILTATEQARRLRTGGKTEEAQKILQEQLALYPTAPEGDAARTLLGEINTERYFAAKSLYGKNEYTVQHGDSLARIARQAKSTPEMIMRANDLSSTTIHPGDKLFVPDGEFSISVDLHADRIVVYHAGAFFKQYPIHDARPPSSSQSRLATKVTAISVPSQGARGARDKENQSPSPPRLNLALSGYSLYGVTETNESSTNATSDAPAGISPRGIALLNGDIEELMLFVTRGTPVTILQSGNMLARH